MDGPAVARSSRWRGVPELFPKTLLVSETRTRQTRSTCVWSKRPCGEKVNKSIHSKTYRYFTPGVSKQQVFVPAGVPQEAVPVVGQPEEMSDIIPRFTLMLGEVKFVRTEAAEEPAKASKPAIANMASRRNKCQRALSIALAF
jgi:hypothetical protein